MNIIEDYDTERNREQEFQERLKKGLKRASKKGLKQGLSQGIEFVAKNMLNNGTDIETIIELTGLSKE